MLTAAIEEVYRLAATVQHRVYRDLEPQRLAPRTLLSPWQ